MILSSRTIVLLWTLSTALAYLLPTLIIKFMILKPMTETAMRLKEEIMCHISIQTTAEPNIKKITTMLTIPIEIVGIMGIIIRIIIISPTKPNHIQHIMLPLSTKMSSWKSSRSIPTFTRGWRRNCILVDIIINDFKLLLLYR